MVTKSNRDLIEEEIDALLSDLSVKHEDIRVADAALRVKRQVADEVRLRSRNLRMALFALDGDVSKTIEDADAANDQHLSRLEG